MNHHSPVRFRVQKRQTRSTVFTCRTYETAVRMAAGCVFPVRIVAFRG